MIEINLLPGVPRSSKSRGIDFAPMAALASVGTQFKDKYLILGGAGFILGLAAIAGMYTFQSRTQASLDARESVAATDSARFSAVLKARLRAETTRDSVYRQLAIIRSIDNTRFTWPHILEEVNLAVPQYTWLKSIAQTSAVSTSAAVAADSGAGTHKPDAAKKPVSPAVAAAAQRAHSDSLFNGAAATITFRIVGQTVDVQALTQFMKNLEASPFIKNVQLTRSDLVTAEGNQVTEFQLEAQSATPPAHLIQTVPLSLAVR